MLYFVVPPSLDWVRSIEDLDGALIVTTEIDQDPLGDAMTVSGGEYSPAVFSSPAEAETAFLEGRGDVLATTDVELVLKFHAAGGYTIFDPVGGSFLDFR